MTNNTQEKIKTLSELSQIIEHHKKTGGSAALCHGVFDLIHPGHIRHLAEAKNYADILVVTITPDRFVNKGPGRPIFNQDLRAEVLAALSQVDFVAINEWPTSIETIHALKPTVYVKGSDYEDTSKDITGNITKEEQAIKNVGGRIVFTHDIVFSSSSLANNYLKPYPEATSTFLKEFKNKTSVQEIIENLNKTTKCKTLVIGDTIIDEYHYCTPMGKSPKENIITTRYLYEEIFAGGVLAAANHVAGFCDQVDLITCTGEEADRSVFIKKNLKPNINPKLFFRNDSPTITKRRFVEPSYMRKLFEICFLNGDAFPDELEQKIYNHLDKSLPQYDLVLITDFGHGLMTPKLIDLVCRKAKFLAVNAQSNSANLGYNLITKYPHVDFICIDEPEARLALHDRTSDIEDITKKIATQLEASSIIITRGNYGCVVFDKKQGFFKIPVLTSTVVDTVGAGDAFLSIASPCAAIGLPMDQVGFIGNAAGALKVGIVGNKSSIEKIPLIRFITTLLK